MSPSTRPGLPECTRDGYRLQWVQNELIANVGAWGARNELEAHVFRKRHMARVYDVSQVLLREPQGTAEHSTDDLITNGVIGLYAWRKTNA